MNPHQIEFMEETPDTVITLMSEKKIIVRESADAVIKRIVAYRNRLFPGAPASSAAAGSGQEF